MFVALMLMTSLDVCAEKPKVVQIFENEQFYKKVERKEGTYQGKLTKVAGAGIGFGRHNPFRLTIVDGKRVSKFEVYIGSKGKVLDPFVGKIVKIVGKRIDMEVEGSFHREIWPATIEVVGKK